MSRFGGVSKFGGSSKFGGVRYAMTPDYIIARMLAAMQNVTNYAKVIPTRKRLVGDPTQRETWQPYLVTGGLPAVLVRYNDSDWSMAVSSGGKLNRLMRFEVYVIASNHRSREYRLRGLNVYEAGAENIVSWCVYWMTRELQGVDSPDGKALLKNAQPRKDVELSFDSKAAIYRIDFVGEKQATLYDDLITLEMNKLGICHTPIDLDILFEDDNVTPYSDDETNNSSNVADLE